MFKKVFLSSLLPVAMTFSMGVTAGAVSDRITRQDCKKFCRYTQNQESQSINKIKGLKKERNSLLRHVCELNKEQFDELKKFIEKANFEEKEEYLKNLYSFYLAQEYGNLEALDKNIKDQENNTRNVWRIYQEACPEVSCKGVYGNVTCDGKTTDIYTVPNIIPLDNLDKILMVMVGLSSVVAACHLVAACSLFLNWLSMA